MLRDGNYQIVDTQCSATLSLPHKGGGNVVALLCPSPLNAPASCSEMCACLSAEAGTQGQVL